MSTLAFIVFLMYFTPSIVALLRQRGVDVRYDVYTDEGHAFTRRDNKLRELRDVATFMEEHLLPADS